MSKVRKWLVECWMCHTGVVIDAETVTSTDQGAVFVKNVSYSCGKCGSACIAKAIDEKGQDFEVDE